MIINKYILFKIKIIIKEINLSNLNEKERELSLQEGIILSKLKHPNIINCYGFYYEKENNNYFN